MKKNLTDEELLNTVKRLDRFATLTDAQFRIPLTRIRFGLDALIGFVPILGDVIGFALSLYLFSEAHKLGVPISLKLKMLRNVLIDFGIGLIPIAGDLADIGFRSNLRNVKLIVEHIESEQKKRKALAQDHPKSHLFWLIFALACVSVFACGYYLYRYLGL